MRTITVTREMLEQANDPELLGRRAVPHAVTSVVQGDAGERREAEERTGMGMKYIAHFSSGQRHLEVEEITGNEPVLRVPCRYEGLGCNNDESTALRQVSHGELRYDRIAWWIPRGAPDETHIMFRHDGRECR